MKKSNVKLSQKDQVNLHNELMVFFQNVGMDFNKDEVLRVKLLTKIKNAGLDEDWFHKTEEKIVEASLMATTEFYSAFEENKDGNYSTLLKMKKEYNLPMMTIVQVALME